MSLSWEDNAAVGIPGVIGPRKVPDPENVYRLARLGCSQREIGWYFGTSQAHIRQTFGAEYERGKAECSISIRRQQLRRARAGSDAMLIHLGKVYCGQSEKFDVTHRVEPATVPYEVGSDGRDPGLELPPLPAAIPPPPREPGPDPDPGDDAA